MDLAVLFSLVEEEPGMFAPRIFAVLTEMVVVTLTESLAGVRVPLSPMERSDDGYFVDH